MGEGRSLLLVEDDETTRTLLSLLLSGDGWAVTAAESGDEALRLLNDTKAPLDVVLSDLQMPGLCGTPMAIALRGATGATGTQANPPLLIAMTATSKNGIPLGFDDLLIKPFTPGDLLQCCEGLWSGKSSGRIKTPQSLAMKPSIAIATFDRMKSSMPLPQLRALYDFALSDAESRIVRLSTATEIGDDISYRREAHALKGSCGMIGAVRLGSLAAVAEDEGLPAATVTELNPIQHFHAEMEQIRHMLESLLPSAS